MQHPMDNLGILAFLLLPFVSSLSDSSLDAYCSHNGQIGLVGGGHNRFVVEGGHVTLTCCTPGHTSGHDHEQLAWYDPDGNEVPNHFANHNMNAAINPIYYIPDYRRRDHLVRVVISLISVVYK